MKYLGGITDIRIRWVSPTAVLITFASNNSDMLHQVYYGRRLVAQTSQTTQRSITTQIPADRWQNHIQIVAVSGEDVGVDHGEGLPDRPYNVAKLTFDASGFPADTKTIEIYRGDAPGGAVNMASPMLVIPFEGAKTYTLFTPPLPGSGTWNLSIVGRDDKLPEGNLGTTASVSVTVNAHPPDLDEDPVITADAGTVTASLTLPTD